MSTRTANAVGAATPPVSPRVRVKLRRVNCNYSKPYPPDGQGKLWWQRLKKALGTQSSDFVLATLIQLQNASRLPGAGISETGMNAALALIEAAEPKNEVEGALAVQMACTHAITMAVLERLGGGCVRTRDLPVAAAAATRLAKTYATQVEAFRRLRNGGTQVVRIERVNVNEGGQAVIGNVNRGTG